MSVYCQYVIHILLRKIINLVRVLDISANRNKYFYEVGFAPTPTFVDQNVLQDRFTIFQSGALDRSAILTSCLSNLDHVSVQLTYLRRKV
jgi:hypothetical protein